MKKNVLIIFFLILFFANSGFAALRYHHPEFADDYSVPEITQPSPGLTSLEYLDAGVLFAALTLAAYLVLKKRSRRSIFLLMLFSLLYFGFWRKGCVCSVGSMQNIALSLFDQRYALPLTATIFFALPLVFSLFFGRVFCAAVCPLGAVQDIAIIRPIKIPGWLAHTLSILPYLYLGLAVLLAMLGADFIICRFDPFVGFFRLSANFSMLILGACFLVIGTVVARPYCRFLCPYGVLLNWTSRLSKYHLTITPDECVQCKLCDNSCPFDAVLKPSPEKVSESHSAGVKRLVVLISITPLLLILGIWLGLFVHAPISRMHATVRVAERVFLEEAGILTDTTLESDAFRRSGKPMKELFDEASVLRRHFKIGSGILGGFMGIVISCKLLALSSRRKRNDYVPDKGTCFSCGRCVSCCPVEHDRLEKQRNTYS